MNVEGLVHITELGGEYFRFDEARQELRGERTGIRYAIGTRVRVQVSRVDLDGRKIDFRLVRDGEELLPRNGAGKDKGPSRDVPGKFSPAASIQNFKAAVKKAYNKVTGKKSAKPAAGALRGGKSGAKKSSGKSKRSR